jgi:hypothetical protein
MEISRRYTIGAVAVDAGALHALGERLAESGVEPDSLVALARRRDEKLVRVILPGAVTRRIETGMSRTKWFEFFSMFLGVTATSLLIGAVHLWTGLVVEALLVIGSIVGLVLYHRQPRLEKKIVSLGLPQRLAGDWAKALSHGFALALVTVPEEDLDEVQYAFLGDPDLQAPLAVDRRVVL